MYKGIPCTLVFGDGVGPMDAYKQVYVFIGNRITIRPIYNAKPLLALWILDQLGAAELIRQGR